MTHSLKLMDMTKWRFCIRIDSKLFSDKGALWPGEQTLYPDNLVCKNFLKQWSYLVVYSLIFLAKNFLVKHLKGVDTNVINPQSQVQEKVFHRIG